MTWIVAIIGALWGVIFIINKLSEVVDEQIENFDNTVVGPTAQWFLDVIWNPATPPERFIIVAVSVLIALFLLQAFDNKKASS